MTPERRATIEREAERLLAAFSTPERQAIEHGLYGARDAQLAAAVVANANDTRIAATLDLVKVQADRITELEAEIASTREANDEDEATLRRLLVEACEIIQDHCTGFSNRIDEMLAEADV